MSNDNNLTAVFSVNYVKEIYFIIQENLIGIEPGKEVLVQMIGKTGYSIDQNILNFSLRTWFHFRDEQAQLAAIEVQNLFNVGDLKNFIGLDNKVNLPLSIWAQIVGISISHTHALFTKNLAGTALQKVMIPIMNPLEVAKNFFQKVLTIV